MIFNTDYTDRNLHSLEGITESPYGCSLEGALMHVYENECNYNAIIKAAGISELKYYQETGGNLFVHEAGAFSNFLEKVKDFLKKVIEKIKQIFKSFMAHINKIVLNDKDFVKKYEKELTRRSSELSSMEFEGWNFRTNAEKNLPIIGRGIEQVGSDIHDNLTNLSNEDYYKSLIKNADVMADNTSNDDLTRATDIYRGMLLGKNTQLDHSDFMTEAKEMIYGSDKEDFKVDIRYELSIIRDNKKEIKEVEKARKDMEKEIDRMIKDVDALSKKYASSRTDISSDEYTDIENRQSDKTAANAAVGARRDKIVKAADFTCSLAKNMSNEFTALFGILISAMKDSNKQARAICVKALSYKAESSFYGSWDDNYYNESFNDLFAGVTIK